MRVLLLLLALAVPGSPHAVASQSTRKLLPPPEFTVDQWTTSQSQRAKFPVTDVFSYIEVADARIRLRPEGVEIEARLVHCGQE